MNLREWVIRYLSAKKQIRELQDWANASEYSQEDLEQALQDFEK